MDKPDQAAQQPAEDWKAKYEALFDACGKANGVRQTLLIKVSEDIGALLKIICEPDPPGCTGQIPKTDLEDLLKDVQKANAIKKQQLQAIDHEIDLLMQKMCDPDPPGCVIGP